MRTLALGDVHGCLTALEALLRLVAPVQGDHLIALGDYVDRGPDSKGVLDCMIELYDAGLLVPLGGNHDEMVVEALYGPRGRVWAGARGAGAAAARRWRRTTIRSTTSNWPASRSGTGVSWRRSAATGSRRTRTCSFTGASIPTGR